MKLLICEECCDVFKLSTHEIRECSCGKVRGAYDGDGLHAWYEGETAKPLGFQNLSLAYALTRQPEEGAGERFVAFVIPVRCPTFRKGEAK